MAHRIVNFYTREEIQSTKNNTLDEQNEFDSPIEAFEYMIAHKGEGSIVLGDILYKIEKTWKPLIVGGLKMQGHYIWNNQVFFILSRYCYYVGELKL